MSLASHFGLFHFILFPWKGDLIWHNSLLNSLPIWKPLLRSRFCPLLSSTTHAQDCLPFTPKMLKAPAVVLCLLGCGDSTAIKRKVKLFPNFTQQPLGSEVRCTHQDKQPCVSYFRLFSTQGSRVKRSKFLLTVVHSIYNKVRIWVRKFLVLDS